MDKDIVISPPALIFIVAESKEEWRASIFVLIKLSKFVNFSNWSGVGMWSLYNIEG